MNRFLPRLALVAALMTVSLGIASAAGPLDINSASKAELTALKGVGDARADAIIKGRPYKGKDELADKGIVPQGVYNDIKDQIIAKQK